jgi:hypothetical protein
VPNVQWKTPDDGQKNCPKYVEFLDKNKFGKISASVGFIKQKFVTMHGYMNVKKSYKIILQFLAVLSDLLTLSSNTPQMKALPNQNICT